MTTKNISIAVITILVIALIGYFGYKSMSTSAAGTPANANSQTDQVQAQEVTVGTGAEAKPGDTVSVLYVGTFSDGTVFDSSELHGNEPLKFVLGAQGMIAGFQIGVNGMKEGGERLISIPPSLAYGTDDIKDAAGKVVIPANSTLVFQIKLVKVVAATTSPAATAQ